MRIIGVISGKGGVGKTTVAINVGAHLVAGHGKRVLIMDTNITTPHVPLHLGMENTPITLNHVMRKTANLKDAIYSHASGLKVMPASISIKDLEGLDMFRLPSVVNDIYERYFGKLDFLILDCAPGFSREAMAAMKSCSEVLMVTSPHMPSVMDIVRCRHFADKLGIKILGTAVNMTKRGAGELKKSDIESITGVKVLASIPYDKAMVKSLRSSMPLVIEKKRAKSSKKIAEIARAIL